MLLSVLNGGQVSMLLFSLLSNTRCCTWFVQGKSTLLNTLLGEDRVLTGGARGRGGLDPHALYVWHPLKFDCGGSCGMKPRVRTAARLDL